MGLCICAKGLDTDKEFRFSYTTYHNMKLDILNQYSTKLKWLYVQFVACSLRCQQIPQIWLDEWNELSNDDLDMFVFHSDCEGTLTPKDCKIIYDVIKDMHSDYSINGINVLERFKECLLHSIKRRVILRYC